MARGHRQSWDGGIVNGPGLATSYAPPFPIVRNHFIVSIVSYVALTFVFVLLAPWMEGHYFQPHLLGMTHLAALGWITTVMMGALYQLVPVVLETRLWSARLARLTLWIYLPGAIGLIGHLWLFKRSPGLWLSGLLLVIAFILFVSNLFATLAQVEKWNLTGIHLLTALCSVVLAVSLGFILSLNIAMPFLPGDHLHYLKAHAHLAFLGWILLVVMGVAYKLIPMFSLAHGYSMTAARWAFGLVSTGIAGLMTAWALDGPHGLEVFYSTLLAAGVFAFLWQMTKVFRNRLRKQADISMLHSLCSLVFLGSAAILGVGLFFMPAEWPQAVREGLVLLYGWIVFIGFAGFIIIGQMYKILPFLVWFNKYSNKAGHEKVPMLKDMFDERLAKIEFALMAAGFLLTSIALPFAHTKLFRAGAILLFASALFFLWNMITIFIGRRHAQ